MIKVWLTLGQPKAQACTVYLWCRSPAQITTIIRCLFSAQATVLSQRNTSNLSMAEEQIAQYNSFGSSLIGEIENWHKIQHRWCVMNAQTRHPASKQFTTDRKTNARGIFNNLWRHNRIMHWLDVILGPSRIPAHLLTSNPGTSANLGKSKILQHTIEDGLQIYVCNAKDKWIKTIRFNRVKFGFAV